MYKLENISFAYDAKTVIADLNLTLDHGHFYGIIGPNGCGKSTLIDLLSGHIRPDKGSIHFKGRRLDRYPRKELARHIALVPQDFRINFPYTCQEIVMMGRYPHIPRFARPAEHDRSVVHKVMQETGLEGFEHRYVHQLSGGERQRVVFSRSLAQQASVLLLDEATSNLDLHHSLILLNLAAQRVANHRLVVAVMQDVNLAAMYCDRLICMNAGGIFASGTLADVLTTDMLRSVFHVQASVGRNEYSGSLQVVIKKEVCA